jgi:hypothetical protein
MPHAAGIAAGRPRSEKRLTLDQHDVRNAALCEVPGDAGAHAPTADDDDVCCRLHDAQFIERDARTGVGKTTWSERIVNPSRVPTLA